MLFSLTDVILIVIVLIFTIGGFALGLIGMIGALLGIVAGVWIASQNFLPVSEWLTPILLDHSGTAKVVAFVVIFLLVNRLVAVLFWVINKAFRVISIIPFLKSINRIGGTILGVVEGVLVSGTVIYVIIKFVPQIEWLVNGLNESQVAHWLVWTTHFLSNLLP